MKMTKAELYEAWFNIDMWNDHIWEVWATWRFEQAELERFRKIGEEENNQWKEIFNSLPNLWEWSINSTENVMVISWEGGEDEVPLENFYEDEDEQPELEMLWHHDYYDGPLSGMARYNGEGVWFACTEDKDNGVRIFGLYRLSEEDENEINRQHELFREMVGHHCDHHPDLYSSFNCRGEKKFREFYDMNLPKIDATRGEKLTEVHWFQFKYWRRPTVDSRN